MCLFKETLKKPSFILLHTIVGNGHCKNIEIFLELLGCFEFSKYLKSKLKEKKRFCFTCFEKKILTNNFFKNFILSVVSKYRLIQ